MHLNFNTNELFIRRIQNALLHDCISVWRRRGKLLLDINCGDGRFLRPLWHNGFDVTATEPNFEMRKKASSAMGERAEIFAAHANELPFDNNAFDWAVLHLQNTDPTTLYADIHEAIRVAAHGLVVTFWNSASPVFLLSPKHYQSIPKFSWLSVWLTLNKLGLGRLTTRSTLFFPYAYLRRFWPKLYFSTYTSRIPLGAWTALRYDMSPQSTVTPLMLPTHLRKIPNLEPLLESRSQH